MKELSWLLLCGITFGSGVTVGGMIAWMLVPNGKGLKEQQEAKDKRIEKLLQDKVDVLLKINETLSRLLERKG